MKLGTVEEIDIKDFGKFLLSVNQKFMAIDRSVPLRKVSAQFKISHLNQFETETGPDGIRWEPWHWRRKEASDQHTTLTDTGALKDSVTDFGPDHIESIENGTLTFGTRKPYAAIHQYGGETKTNRPLVGRGGKGYLPAGVKINLPARPFLGVSESAMGWILKVIVKDLVTLLKKAL